MEFDRLLLQMVSPAFETARSLAGSGITMDPYNSVTLFMCFVSFRAAGGIVRRGQFQN